MDWPWAVERGRNSPFLWLCGDQSDREEGDLFVGCGADLAAKGIEGRGLKLEHEFMCVCVSTPVSKDTTLTLSNLPYDFCDQCTAAGGHSTHHQGVANEEPGGVVLKTYLPF